MFAKLLAIFLTLGITGIALLVMRQQRIDASHEMTSVHRRLVRHETELWELRSRLIKHIRPEIVNEQIEQLDANWATIPAPGPAMPASEDTFAASNEESAQPAGW